MGAFRMDIILMRRQELCRDSFRMDIILMRRSRVVGVHLEWT